MSQRHTDNTKLNQNQNWADCKKNTVAKHRQMLQDHKVFWTDFRRTLEQ